MRWIAIVVFLLPQLGRAAEDNPAALFDPKAPPLKIELTIDKDNKAILDKDPRKYVRCSLRVGAINLENVGFHLKGAAGSFRNWDDKPALTFNADKFVKGQTLSGLDKFHLNNSVQDPAYFNEIIAGELFRKAGLPAARFTHVRVELNGRKVGMYLLKEGYDKTFLKRFFADATGNLYDGGFVSDIDATLKQDGGPDKDRQDLKALVKACQEGDAKKRAEAVGKLVDVDKLITLAVMEVLICDWDGYARNRNNYRLYHDPKSGQFVFIPHGKDQLFQNPGDALWHGWQGMVARAVLDNPEGRKRYFARMNELTDKVFTPETINGIIDAYLPRAKEIAGKIEKNRVTELEGQVAQLRQKIKERIEYVRRELPKQK